jgi:hypothetical protein
MTGRSQKLTWWLWGEGAKTTGNKIYCPVAYESLYKRKPVFILWYAVV